MKPALRTGKAEPSEDLRDALQRLAAARVSLGQAEESFATYCRELAAFANDYRLYVGDICEELDRLSAQLEAVLAQRPVRRPAAKRQGTSAASSVTGLTLSLRDLYRLAARRFHPDLAGDPADNEWRAAMMRRVNAAFASRDSTALRTLLDQAVEAYPVPISPANQIEREIARVLARLDDLRAARQQMEAADIGQLHAQATADGQDAIGFLRRLAAAVRAEILEKRALLAQLTAPEPRR
jgi:hypothetical protein